MWKNVSISQHTYIVANQVQRIMLMMYPNRNDYFQQDSVHATGAHIVQEWF